MNDFWEQNLAFCKVWSDVERAGEGREILLTYKAQHFFLFDIEGMSVLKGTTMFQKAVQHFAMAFCKVKCHASSFRKMLNVPQKTLCRSCFDLQKMWRVGWFYLGWA